MTNPDCEYCHGTGLAKLAQWSPPGFIYIDCPQCLFWLQGPSGESQIERRRGWYERSEDAGLAMDKDSL